jgi:hypothetical protein
MNFSKKVISFLLVSVMILAGSFTGKIIFATEETAKNELPIAVIGGGLPKGIFFGPTYLNIEQQRLYVCIGHFQ